MNARPVQKSVALMENLVGMVAKSEDLELDVFSKTHFTAKSCLLLNHRSFV